MKTIWVLLPALLAAALLVAGSPDEEGSCASLGFTGMQLCSDCRVLGEYVKDEALVTKCLECCAEDTKEGDRVVFTSATLEYCPVSLRHYVHVDSFLREHEKEPLPALKLRQRLGMPPRLVLKGSGQSTTVPIGQWKVEHIREYLAERVNPAGGDQAAEA